MNDNELRVIVDGVMAHYDEIFRLKSVGAKADVFHMLSGMWKTPAERCFMWLGGFRSSEVLKVVNSHSSLVSIFLHCILLEKTQKKKKKRVRRIEKEALGLVFLLIVS